MVSVNECIVTLVDGSTLIVLVLGSVLFEQDQAIAAAAQTEKNALTETRMHDSGIGEGNVAGMRMITPPRADRQETGNV
jgi:hypothetical protein